MLLVGGCRPPSPAPPRPDEPTVRVVSLAPSLTEMACAVGGVRMLVGRTSACNYPPGVADIPIVGSFGDPSIERLIEVRPTLILQADLADSSIGRKLDELGLRRLHVPCRRLADVPPALRRLGIELGLQPEGERLAGEMEQRVAQLRASMPPEGTAPRVFVEIWNDPVMTVGRTSFVSELVRLAGGHNIGDESETEYYQASPEWVIARNPQVILCLYENPTGSFKEAVARRAGWDRTDAARTGRIYGGLNNDTLLRPGPRVLEGIEDLKRCLGEGAPSP